MWRRARHRPFLQDRDCEDSGQHHHSDQRKAVGVAHNRSLGSERLTDCDDVRQEIVLKIGKPVARRRLKQGDLRRDDRRVELFAIDCTVKHFRHFW